MSTSTGSPSRALSSDERAAVVKDFRDMEGDLSSAV
jgi:hypothetical protein